MKILIWGSVIVIATLLNELQALSTGFRIGPVFLYVIVYFVAKKLCKMQDEKTRKKRRSDIPDGWYACPTCGGLIRVGGHCSACTAKLLEEDEPTVKEPAKEAPTRSESSQERTLPFLTDEPQPDSPIPPVQYCRKCGALLLPEGSFCNKCGTKIMRE